MKTFRILSTALASVMLAFSLTSCGDNDEPEPPKEAKPESTTVNYKLYIDEEMAKLIHVEAEYRELDGEMQVASLENAPSHEFNGHKYCVLNIEWKNKKLPFAGEVRFHVEKRQDVEVPEKVGVSQGTEMTWKVKYDDGTESSNMGTSLSLSIMTIPGARFDEYLERVSERLAEPVIIEIDKDGKLAGAGHDNDEVNE